MPARPADKRLQNEGYILLAIQALQKDENLSVARAAQLYNVPRTLCNAGLMAKFDAVKPVQIAITLLLQKRRLSDLEYYQWTNEAIH
jgi:hypothetical protein